MNKWDIMMKDLMIEIRRYEMIIKTEKENNSNLYNNEYNFNLGILDGLKKAYRIVKYSSI